MSTQEYFRSGDMVEMQRSIVELDCPEYSYELVKRAVSMSLDRSDREREQISQLLSDSYPDVLSTNMIGKGFERLFELADEFQKDVPLCREHIAKFLARCVVDEVLPPSYLSDVVVRNLGGDIVEHAMRMLSREHGSAMLEHAWGPGDGRPVTELKVGIYIMLAFVLTWWFLRLPLTCFFKSSSFPMTPTKRAGQLLACNITSSIPNDIDNPILRCIRELNSTYFLHEVVKKGVSASLDSNEEKQILMSDLFTKLVNDAIMPKEQCGLGFTRLLEAAADLALDIPAAPGLIQQFITRASADGILPEAFPASAGK
jgi:programmed cell death protein 4